MKVGEYHYQGAVSILLTSSKRQGLHRPPCGKNKDEFEERSIVSLSLPLEQL